MFHGSWLLQSDTSAAHVSGLIRASFLPHKSSPPIVGMLTHTQERQHHSTKRESVYPHFVYPYILYSIYYKHLCTVHTKVAAAYIMWSTCHHYELRIIRSSLEWISSTPIDSDQFIHSRLSSARGKELHM